MKLKMLASWKKSYDQPRQHIKKQRRYFTKKSPSSQGYGFSSSHVWMWELDHKESWVLKKWCFCIVVMEKTLESPLDCKELQSVHPKGNQSWIFIGKTDAKAEVLILWLPDAKNQLIWKDPDAGEDWRWDEKRTTEDEMWQHDVMTCHWCDEMSLSRLWELMEREAWSAEFAKSPIGLSNWTELSIISTNCLRFWVLWICV